jgi:carbonic anhydrase
MKLLRTPLTLLVLALLPLAACSSSSQETPASHATPAGHAAPVASSHGGNHGTHWGYEGETGPEHWGDLDPAFERCETGITQTPINLAHADSLPLPNPVFNYRPSKLRIVNNGHTIQANYDEGSVLTLGDHTYQLVQFHFHTPSEHTLQGEHFPMEVHLVHKDEQGTLAVVGILMQQGVTHNLVQTIWDKMPTEAGPEQVFEETINALTLLPKTQTTWRYTGSLTTPPCSEGVNWFVMTTPIEVSEAQAAAFKVLFKNNARPVQPLLDRTLLVDASAN